MQGNGLLMDVGNPKKNEDLPCLQSRGKSKFGSLAMAFPLRISRRRILLSRKMCGLYQWEFWVFFYFSRQTKSNLGKIASYTSHNFLHLTISLPLSLILRERGRHELPSFSPLIFHGYWQTGWIECCFHRVMSIHYLKTDKNPTNKPTSYPKPQKCQLWHPRWIPSTQFFLTKLSGHHIGT